MGRPTVGVAKGARLTVGAVIVGHAQTFCATIAGAGPIVGANIAETRPTVGTVNAGRAHRLAGHSWPGGMEIRRTTRASQT